MADLTIPGAPAPEAAAAAPVAAAAAAAPAPEAAVAAAEANPWKRTFTGRDGAAVDLDVPEPFRGAEPGSLNEGALLKSWHDMRTQAAARQVPEAYDFAKAVPEDAKGLVADLLDDKAPLRGPAVEMFKAKGFTQDQVDAVVELAAKRDKMLSDEAERLSDEASKAAMAEAVTLMGTEEKVKGVFSWFASVLGLGPDEFVNLPAKALPKLEALRASLGPAGVATGKDVAPAAGKMTEAELKDLMASKPYWKDKDPATIKKVSDGFKQLYDKD